MLYCINSSSDWTNTRVFCSEMNGGGWKVIRTGTCWKLSFSSSTLWASTLQSVIRGDSLWRFYHNQRSASDFFLALLHAPSRVGTPLSLDLCCILMLKKNNGGTEGLFPCRKTNDCPSPLAAPWITSGMVTPPLATNRNPSSDWLCSNRTKGRIHPVVNQTDVWN